MSSVLDDYLHIEDIIATNKQIEALTVVLRHLLRANERSGEYTNPEMIHQVLLAIEDMSDRIDTAANKLGDGQMRQEPALPQPSKAG